MHIFWFRSDFKCHPIPCWTVWVRYTALIHISQHMYVVKWYSPKMLLLLPLLWNSYWPKCRTYDCCFFWCSTLTHWQTLFGAPNHIPYETELEREIFNFFLNKQQHQQQRWITIFAHALTMAYSVSWKFFFLFLLVFRSSPFILSIIYDRI